MPHGNPDGAHYFRRSPHGTVDINRDHVKMVQPNANAIAVALEPESPSSFVTYGIVPVDKKGAPATIASSSEAPIYRVTVPVELDTRTFERQ